MKNYRKNKSELPAEQSSAGVNRLSAKAVSVLYMLLLLTLSVQLGALVNQSVEKPDTLYLGSKFRLNLTSDAEIIDVIIPDTLTAFTVSDRQVIKQKGKPKGLALDITVLDTGEQAFPALTVKKLSSTQDTDITRPFRLTILETRSPQDSLLMDIAPVRKLKGELPLWAYFVIPLVMLLAAVTFLLWYLRERRRKKAALRRTAPALIDSRPNWKKALEDLYLLNQQKLPEQGEYITYHFRLSEIMKQFLEADYSFPANEMTTREIRHFLKSAKHRLPPEPEKLLNWLDDCDKVKFAKYVPSLDDCADKMDWFMRWLMVQRKAEDTTSEGASQ